MAKKPKKRRRRTLNITSEETWCDEVEDAHEAVLALSTLDFRVLADLANAFLPYFKGLRLDTASFFYSDRWDDALSSIGSITGVDHLADRAREDGNLSSIFSAELEPVALDLYWLSYFWELVFGLADPGKIHEKPRAGEHPFHFMSMVTSRYQVIYRVLGARFPDDDQSGIRHAICRYLRSDLFDNPLDAQEETLSATLLTELWISGNNEFAIGPELREMFMQTDVDNLAPPALPYAAFHVTTGQEQLMFTSAVHKVAGVRVWIMWSKERGSVQLMERLGQEDTLGDIWGRLPEGFWHASPESENACREAFLIICNLCLYMETQDAQVRVEGESKGTKPAEEDRRGLKRYAKRQMTPVRRVLYPGLDVSKSANVAGASHTRRHWVRGHWRWQAYWPNGRDDEKINKRIWIKPHLRGEGDATYDTPRTYKVDE